MEVGDTVQLKWDCHGWLQGDQGVVQRIVNDIALVERTEGSPEHILGVKIPIGCAEVVV